MNENLAEFDIYFKKWYDNRTYRAKVILTYMTENVQRFTITAGEKRLLMEKHLFKKSGQWKVSRFDFTLKGNTKDNAVLLMNIQDAIDREMNKLYP